MGIVMFPYQQPSETAVKGFPGSLRRLGHGGQGRTQAGLLPLEVRPEPMANAIAFDREVEIGGIGERDDSLGRDERLQNGPIQIQEWTQNRPSAAVDSLKSGKSAPRSDSQKKGLDLIVPVVRGKDPVGADALAKDLEGRIPHPARRRLTALAPLRGLRHRMALGGERQPQLHRDRRRPRRPFARARVEPVVDMEEVEIDSLPRRELSKPRR